MFGCAQQYYNIREMEEEINISNTNSISVILFSEIFKNIYYGLSFELCNLFFDDLDDVAGLGDEISQNDLK